MKDSRTQEELVPFKAFGGFRLRFWLPFAKLSVALTVSSHLLKKNQYRTRLRPLSSTALSSWQPALSRWWGVGQGWGSQHHSCYILLSFFLAQLLCYNLWRFSKLESLPIYWGVCNANQMRLWQANEGQCPGDLMQMNSSVTGRGCHHFTCCLKTGKEEKSGFLLCFTKANKLKYVSLFVSISLYLHLYLSIYLSSVYLSSIICLTMWQGRKIIFRCLGHSKDSSYVNWFIGFSPFSFKHQVMWSLKVRESPKAI